MTSKQRVVVSNPAWDAIPPAIPFVFDLMQSGNWCT